MMNAHDDPFVRYIPAAKVARRYGVTLRSIDRWIGDPTRGFPRYIRLGRLRYWDIQDLERYERERVEARAMNEHA